MANRKKRPSYGTAKQKDVEALMGALLTQVRAEMADAINLALRRHDERYHAPTTHAPYRPLYDCAEHGVTYGGCCAASLPVEPGTPVEVGPWERARYSAPSLYMPEPSKLIGLNGEPL